MWQHSGGKGGHSPSPQIPAIPGFCMPLILAEQSVRHNKNFVCSLDDFFEMKHLLTRRGLSVIKAMGQPRGEATVQPSYILREALKSVDSAPF